MTTNCTHLRLQSRAIWIFLDAEVESGFHWTEKYFLNSRFVNKSKSYESAPVMTDRRNYRIHFIAFITIVNMRLLKTIT